MQTIAAFVTMLIATADAAGAAAVAPEVAVPAGRAPSSFRQLQFFPQLSNNEDAGVAPNAFPGRDAFPGMERETFPDMGRQSFPGMDREAFPENDMPIGAAGDAWGTDMAARNWNGNAMNGAGVEADSVANATTDGAAATADATSPQAAGAAATTDIAPGQPTIMVLLPDFLAAGSGWSSYSDDVSATHAPETKPVEEETPTSAASRPSSSRVLVAVVTLAVSIGAIFV